MRQEHETIDISASPELLRLAEEVQASGKARVLRRKGEDVAVIVPLSATETRRRLKKPELSPEALAAFRSAAGTWADVDVEQFLADVYAARDVQALNTLAENEFPKLVSGNGGI